MAAMKDRHCPRIDTLELKHHIRMKLGPEKSDRYFILLSKYLSLHLSKLKFDKLCISLLGEENISLHNGLIQAIIKNASLANAPPNKDPKSQSNGKSTNGFHNSLHLLRDVLPPSPRKGRTPICRDRKIKDRPSPLGPNGKSHSHIHEQQSATEIFSLGSRPPVEVTSEEGEEVEQAAVCPGKRSRALIKAPLGICFNPKKKQKVVLSDLDTCYNNVELPDTKYLQRRLERKLTAEGLNVSTYCVNLINSGVDVFLKRLLEPCLNLDGLRTVRRTSLSVMDLEAGMQLNPRLLGKDWPLVLEKVGLLGSGDVN